MNRLTRHVLVPAVAPLAIVGLYFTPVTLMGCVNRGLVAVTIVLASLLAGIAAGVLGLRARAGNDASSSGWWMASAFILLLPALLVLGPLG